MNFLFTHGINVPKPIKTSTGDILTTYDGKPAVILSFLNGRDIKLDHIQANHCAELGRFLAKMHQTSDKSSLTHSNKLSLDDWFDLFNKCQTSAPDDFSDMIKTITSELKFLKENWPSGLSQGLIHADLFPDNVFFEQDKLSGVIDFYFSCTDFYSYDVAICLNAWCFDHQNYTYDLQKAKSFLTAYQNTRPLSDADKTAFPILCRGAALRFLLTRLYDWFTPPKDALVKPKNPEEYYKKLLFHQKIAHFEEYLTS